MELIEKEKAKIEAEEENSKIEAEIVQAENKELKKI